MHIVTANSDYQWYLNSYIVCADYCFIIGLGPMEELPKQRGKYICQMSAWSLLLINLQKVLSLLTCPWWQLFTLFLKYTSYLYAFVNLHDLLLGIPLLLFYVTYFFLINKISQKKKKKTLSHVSCHYFFPCSATMLCYIMKQKISD